MANDTAREVVMFWDGQKFRFCPSCQSMAFDFAEAYHTSRLSDVASSFVAEKLDNSAKPRIVPTQKPALAHETRVMLATHLAKYHDPNNLEWDWADVHDKWKRHAYNAFEDLQKLESDYTAVKELSHEDLCRLSRVFTDNCELRSHVMPNGPADKRIHEWLQSAIERNAK